MPPVKGDLATFRKRVDLLLRLFSPWREKALTYGELAEKMGAPFSEEAVKSWVKRGTFAAEARERLLGLATQEGLEGVTLTWLKHGTDPQPHKRGALPSGWPQGASGVAERPIMPSSGGRQRDAGPRAPGGDAASSIVGLVRDALIGAVDRALARDHELEQTRRGYAILGEAFLDLAIALHENGVDTTELMRVARELQKRGNAS